MMKRLFLCGVLSAGLLPMFQSLRAQVIENQNSAAYISRCFKEYGLEFIYSDGVQDFSVVESEGDTLSSQNIVGIISGSDPLLREEYIVIGAPYDHNESGVAMMLELAKTIAAQPWFFKRSLVFVAFGAKEIGSAGSWYFVNRAFSPINKTVFMINFDMIDRSGYNNTFSAYMPKPNVEISELLWSVDLPSSFLPKIFDVNSFPSDHYHFFQKQIPALLFTGGSPAEMEGRVAYMYDFLRIVATLDPLPMLSSAGADGIYTLSQVDKRPKFQHGDEAQFLKLWVNKYLKYPDAAVAQGIQGRVLVQFVIEVNGSVGHVQVMQSVDPLLDDEALRVVAASPKWKPGVKNGKAVRTQYVIPVYFVLKKR
ncbi:MAG: TonB family protein, partial [Bacteroidetes bacterium]|nr:TonB family protein [Bacteroidota bacterium]